MDLAHDLKTLRREFPILGTCTYLISNSLGAVPRQTKTNLEKYYKMWEEEGVTAWQSEWWGMAGRLGNRLASFLHAKPDSVAMIPHATQAHWIALSTCFQSDGGARNRIVMTDLDFPSTLYAVEKISEFMGWRIDRIKSNGRMRIDKEEIIERIDERTLFVATSHVYFKSAAIQDICSIATRAREYGALTLIDGYHAPGTLPVDLENSGVDFYVGGCLKWLCGGPGNAFLYVRPELAERVSPALTGWFAHKLPFAFETEMEYTEGAYRFMSGTHPIPCLYAAEAGLDIISQIGIKNIREKSIHQTGIICKEAENRGFELFSPAEKTHRGGAVSIGLPHAFQVKQALEERNVKVDFRKGKKAEPDVIRIAPHFYTTDEEIYSCFLEADDILTTGAYTKYPEDLNRVT